MMGEKPPDSAASNAIWSILNQLSKTAALAIWMLVLTRFLPPEKFGALVFGFSCVRVFAVVATLGLDKIIVENFAMQNGVSRGSLLRIFWLKLAGVLLAYVGMLLTVHLAVPLDRLILNVVAIAGLSLFFQAVDVLDFHFQAKSMMRWIFMARGPALAISAVLKATALFSSASLLTFAVLEAVEAGLLAVGLIVVFLLQRPQTQVQSAVLSRKTILVEGLPLFLSSLAVIVYMRVDILMLGQMVGSSMAGLYAAAAQLSEIWAFLPVALAPVVFPHIVQWKKLSADEYRKKYQNVLQWSVLLALPMILFLSLSAEFWILLIYGNKYAPASEILALHVWSGLFIFIGIAQTGFDVVDRLTWFSTMRTVVGMFINISLNIWLIPLHGAKGAALATVVAYGFSAWLLNAIPLRTRPIFWMQTRALLLVPFWKMIFSGRKQT